MKYRRRTKINWPLMIVGIVIILVSMAGLGYAVNLLKFIRAEVPCSRS